MPGLKYAPIKTISPITRTSIKIFSMNDKIRFLFVFVVFCMLFVAACNSKDTKKETISFSPDSSKILIDLEVPDAVSYVQNILLIDSTGAGLVEVLDYRQNLDSLNQEMPVTGSYKLNGNFLEFTPTTPFVKGDFYLVTTYVGLAIGDAKAMLTRDLNLRGKPQSKTLER